MRDALLKRAKDELNKSDIKIDFSDNKIDTLDEIKQNTQDLFPLIKREETKGRNDKECFLINSSFSAVHNTSKMESNKRNQRDLSFNHNTPDISQHQTPHLYGNNAAKNLSSIRLRKRSEKVNDIMRSNDSNMDKHSIKSGNVKNKSNNMMINNSFQARKGSKKSFGMHRSRIE